MIQVVTMIVGVIDGILMAVNSKVYVDIIPATIVPALIPLWFMLILISYRKYLIKIQQNPRTDPSVAYYDYDPSNRGVPPEASAPLGDPPLYSPPPY